ncbi:MAG: histidine phosphatase family protein, partial [Lachnospiraceae bacterium]|nr:histidine phosphatase family protein [Lachnospiraceae bacterium]
NKSCGATDIGLTPRGHEQAIELVNMIKEKLDAGEIHIDEIVASPLSRAYDTAKHVADITVLPIRADERLREQNFGRYEGTPRNGEEFRGQKRNFINSYEGGETMLRLAQRIYNILDELSQDDKIYLIVAHNGIVRCVNSYFYDMTNEEYGDFGIRNCELKEYRFL